MTGNYNYEDQPTLQQPQPTMSVKVQVGRDGKLLCVQRRRSSSAARAAFFGGSESSRESSQERKFHGAKVSGSESSTEQNFQGAKVPQLELSLPVKSPVPRAGMHACNEYRHACTHCAHCSSTALTSRD